MKTMVVVLHGHKVTRVLRSMDQVEKQGWYEEKKWNNTFKIPLACKRISDLTQPLHILILHG